MVQAKGRKLPSDRVIPLGLLIDLSDPGVVAEGAEPVWCEPVPGFAGGIHDGLLVGVRAMRQEAFAKVEPDALDWVQLGA